MERDLLDEIAVAIDEVAACHLRGRRYRAIAAWCDEDVLAPALEIGSQIRLARRGGLTSERAAATLDRLRTLKSACESAIAGVRASAAYRSALDAWHGGRYAEVAQKAPALFAAVDPYPDCPTLHHPIAVATRRGGTEHFTTPAACAEAIGALARDGVAPERALDLGADETIRAVVLSDDPEATESPITLAIDPQAIGLPICRLEPAGDALVYTPRLRVPFRVRFAAAVSDEWWAIQPEAYRHYVDALRAELAARGMDVTKAP